MIVKYLTDSWGNKGLVDRVEVERETDKSVFWKGRNGTYTHASRQDKCSSYGVFHDSYQVARDHALNSSQGRADSCREKLEDAERNLEEARNLPATEAEFIAKATGKESQ